MGKNRDVETLIRLLARLPGLGPRSAPRAALHLLKRRSQLLDPLAESMSRVAQTVRHCDSCGNITTANLCEICTDPKRMNGQVCVVEDVSDLWAIERTAVFSGSYHVLGGVLSIIDGAGPDELRIPGLLARVESGGIQEVILALGSTVEGQTTAHYIADQLEECGVHVTTLARGVPVGGELDFLDDGTISTAIHLRRVV
ncbi:MAG: recombination mediator RecR [Paracoccaceae bacterium]|nr:recombination mediator RecR [Paracoccaceae bacterium]MDE2911923.1 recombination mediator RecR [Paracoccaceae bacterium]